MTQFYVYILTNRSKTLYIGVTGNLARRIEEHRSKEGAGFTRRYRIDKLVYYEVFPYVRDAISREKQLKGWLRTRKIELIESLNPGWEDLSLML